MTQTNHEQEHTKWLVFVNSLKWERGALDKSTYQASLRAGSLEIPQNIVLMEIEKRIAHAGDNPSPAKIQSQIERAFEYAGKEQTGLKSCPAPKREFKPEVLRRIASQIKTEDIFAYIKSRSPICVDQVTSQSFLEMLYPKGERVIIFTVCESQGQAVWPDERSIPTGGNAGVWFLVNPVDGHYYLNPRTHTRSRRSQESVSDFRFAVLESDKADTGDWLKCLVQMPLRIAAVYESGGRSIHALVQVDAKTKEEWDCKIKPIKPALITLGADEGALTAVRLSRLPQAKRADRVQRLLYFNPSPDYGPICKRAEFSPITAAEHNEGDL